MSTFCDLYEKICNKYTEKSSRFVALISVGRSIRQARSLISPISSPSPTNYNCNNNNNASNNNNNNSNLNANNNNNLKVSNSNPNIITTTATATANTTTTSATSTQQQQQPSAIFQSNIEPKLPNPEDMYIGFNDIEKRVKSRKKIVELLNQHLQFFLTLFLLGSRLYRML